MQILHALAEFDWSTESCYSVFFFGGGGGVLTFVKA